MWDFSHQIARSSRNTIRATAFVGDGSGLTNLGAGKIGGLNIEMSGNLNVAIGKDSFTNNTNGVSNVAIGERSMSVSNTSGSWNTAVGAASLLGNSTGYENTAIGAGGIESNTTGYKNTAIGLRALNANTEGFKNIAIGEGALESFEVYLDQNDATTLNTTLPFQNNNNSIEVEVENNATYYWKVVAIDTNGNQSSSGVYAFRTN